MLTQIIWVESDSIESIELLWVYHLTLLISDPVEPDELSCVLRYSRAPVISSYVSTVYLSVCVTTLWSMIITLSFPLWFWSSRIYLSESIKIGHHLQQCLLRNLAITFYFSKSYKWKTILLQLLVITVSQCHLFALSWKVISNVSNTLVVIILVCQYPLSCSTEYTIIWSLSLKLLRLSIFRSSRNSSELLKNNSVFLFELLVFTEH